MAISVYVPQAESVQNWTLIPSAQYLSSDATDWWPCDFFSSEGITVVCTTLSGSLDVYLQKLLPDDSTASDIAHWTQRVTGTFTTTAAETLNFVNGGNTIVTDTDAALAANTVQTVHFGSQQRIKYVITGSASFGVFGTFRA